MRGRLATLTLVTAASASFAQVAGDADAHYRALVEAAKANPATADWGALRRAYAGASDFDLLGAKVLEARKAIKAKLEAGDASGALECAKALIEAEFADPDGHLAAAAADDRLGRPGEAARERAIGVGLLRSLGRGDGASAETAFTVIRVTEEYELLEAMGRRVTRQTLAQKDGHRYDVLATTDAGGGEKSFWFLIDDVWAREQDALRSPSGPPRFPSVQPR